MSIDAKSALRRIKPDKRLHQLVARPPVWTAETFSPGLPVLLDTNIYVLNASGRLPTAVARILDSHLLFHCATCVGELLTGVAGYSPSAVGWRALRDHYQRLIDAIPSTRLLTPDEDVWAEAGLVAGVLSRTQGFQPHQRKECLNDALIFLTAAKAGLPVLTANAADFDLIQQVCGRGAFVAT